MAFYIWLDKDGKETERKPKTRGRPPVGAVANTDGNSYITEGWVKQTKISLSVPATDTDEIPDMELETQDTILEQEPKVVKHRKSKKNPNYTEIEYDDTPNVVEIKEIKCYKETTKIHMKDFLKCCFVDPADFITSDQIIILNRVVMVAETGLLNIKFNSAYSRIEIDINENVTRVWSICPKNPSFYIQDLFLDFEID